MKALRLTRWKHPAELVETKVPTPGPGQVLLKIAGSGACHSDLHLMDWPEGQFPWPMPFTIGHENAGWVERVGDGVTSVKQGDPVLVYGPWGCGMCHPCRLGRENYCDRAGEIGAMGGGLGIDGGMAEYMLVPSARLLVPLGNLDPVRAAPLSDAGLTPYHAIRSARARLTPGATAVVIGAGGLGQMAIQLLKVTTGATVIAVDTDENKLELARSFGADAVVLSNAGAAEAVRREAGGRADVVFDMVGADATLALGAKILRPEGRLVIVGLAGGAIPISFFALPMGAQVATSYWGTLPELMELVDLAQRRKLRLEVETFPLDQAPEVYAKLRRGEIRGRAVIVPGR
ncbi:MAG: NAD(P)-dependent alcohol dehydrogenase [Myxococcales bacterium]|nr:NAD(P)-dependent alcohol dehydrogenase [Myxococcales bacterium]